MSNEKKSRGRKRKTEREEAAKAAKATKTKPVVVARSRDASVRSSVQVGSRDASKRRAGVRGAVTKRDGQRTRSRDASKPAAVKAGRASKSAAASPPGPAPTITTRFAMRPMVGNQLG